MVLCAAVDIHKHVFQAVVLDPTSGEVEEARFAADRDRLREWAERLVGRKAVIAVEATTGWRWVVAELQALGLDVRLADPGQARALQGRRRRAKTDRLDARWLALLLSREMLPEAWIPPAEIQELRDVTRLRKTLTEERTRWAQRLHAFLVAAGDESVPFDRFTAPRRRRVVHEPTGSRRRVRSDQVRSTRPVWF